MSSVASLVQSLGGIAQKQQLVKRGARDLDLTRAVRNGSVSRARQGWYTTLPGDDLRVRAVRVGGRLAGISAVIQAGGWVLGNHPLHVSVPRNAARLRQQGNRRVRFDPRQPRGVVLHWDDPELGERGTVDAVGLADALRQVIQDEDLETAVAAVDWALRSDVLDQVDWNRIVESLPSELQCIATWVDPLCDSLPESLGRTRLRIAGHVVRSQVAMGHERIDLLVDECVAIEADGEEFHLYRFEQDRGKDARIAIDRMHGLRPSARMIFYDWATVLLAIEISLETHRDSFENSGVTRPPPMKIPRKPVSRIRPRRRIPEFAKATRRGRRARV